MRFITCSLEALAQGAIAYENFNCLRNIFIQWRNRQTMNHVFSEWPKPLEHEKNLR